MTREEMLEIGNVMNAFLNGGTIQVRQRGNPNQEWSNCPSPSFDFSFYTYRIKPEPRLRPWRDMSEFPSGDVWLHSIGSPTPDCRVVCISEVAVTYIDITIKKLKWGDNQWLGINYSNDGRKTWLPCGVLEAA